LFLVAVPLARLRQIPAPEETLRLLHPVLLPEVTTETIFVSVKTEDGLRRLPLYTAQQLAAWGVLDTNDGVDPVVRLANLLRRFDAAEAADAAIVDPMMEAIEAEHLARAEAALAAARAA
jgi:hypothetical protein